MNENDKKELVTLTQLLQSVTEQYQVQLSSFQTEKSAAKRIFDKLQESAQELLAKAEEFHLDLRFYSFKNIRLAQEQSSIIHFYRAYTDLLLAKLSSEYLSHRVDRRNPQFKGYRKIAVLDYSFTTFIISAKDNYDQLINNINVVIKSFNATTENLTLQTSLKDLITKVNDIVTEAKLRHIALPTGSVQYPKSFIGESSILASRQLPDSKSASDLPSSVAGLPYYPDYSAPSAPASNEAKDLTTYLQRIETQVYSLKELFNLNQAKKKTNEDNFINYAREINLTLKDISRLLSYLIFKDENVSQKKSAYHAINNLFEILADQGWHCGNDVAGLVSNPQDMDSTPIELANVAAKKARLYTRFLHGIRGQASTGFGSPQSQVNELLRLAIFFKNNVQLFDELKSNKRQIDTPSPSSIQTALASPSPSPDYAPMESDEVIISVIAAEEHALPGKRSNASRIENSEANKRLNKISRTENISSATSSSHSHSKEKPIPILPPIDFSAYSHLFFSAPSVTPLVEKPIPILPPISPSAYDL